MRIVKAPRTVPQLYVLVGLGFALLGALGGLVLSLVTTPVYEADARMLVSTTGRGVESGASYQEVTASQQVALSLVQLAPSKSVAERVVETLDLDMSPEELAKNVEATVEPETVIINIAVVDSSPSQAREIANTTAFEFSDFVNELNENSDPAAVRPRLALVQPAVTPVAPITPITGRNVALGGLAGLAAGLLLANARVRTDRRVRDGSAVGVATGEAVLGSVPYAPPRRRSDRAMPITDDVLVSERFRELRTTVAYSLRGTPSKVVAICSAGPGEGRTTTTIGIAESLAAADQRVLVVDADMRTMGLSMRLGLGEGAGLSEALAGAWPVEDFVHPVAGQSFGVVPAGSASLRPSELLSTNTARAVFSRLGETYDYVLVDTPPLLAFTDGVVIATLSDGVVLVARCGEVRSDELGSAVTRLRRVGAPILGSVLSFAPVTRILRRSLGSRSRGGSARSTLGHDLPAEQSSFEERFVEANEGAPGVVGGAESNPRFVQPIAAEDVDGAHVPTDIR